MSFWSRTRRANKSKAPRRSRSRLLRPFLENLEERVLPSTHTVVNTNDSGGGSLRQAILDANGHTNSGGPDVIAFNIGGNGTQTVALASALPAVSDAVLIDGTTQAGYS